MIAYKGFHSDLTCTLGQGRMQYKLGVKIREDSSKCGNRGMHCAEYVIDCLAYYPLGRGNRYFEVEASGSIDEDGENSKIACTEMTLIRELYVKDIAFRAMVYMVEHPKRDWEATGTNLMIKRDSAEGAGVDCIAIARGRNPKVQGKAGTVMGLLQENEAGEITEIWYFVVDEKAVDPDRWYTLADKKEVKERRKAG